MKYAQDGMQTDLEGDVEEGADWEETLEGGRPEALEQGLEGCKLCHLWKWCVMEVVWWCVVEVVWWCGRSCLVVW